MGKHFASTVLNLAMGVRGRGSGAVLDGSMSIRVADFVLDEVMGIRIAGDSSSDGNEHSSRPFPFEHVMGIFFLDEPTAIFIRTLSRGTSSDGSCVCGPELDASSVAGASVDDDVDPVLVLEDRWTIIVRDTVRTRAECEE